MTASYHRIETKVSLVCILCSRVAGTIQGGVLYPRPDVDRAYLVRRVCPACGGRLWAQDPETVVVFLKVPTDPKPKRGRPLKPPASPDAEGKRRRQREYNARRQAMGVDSSGKRFCLDCNQRRIKWGRLRCRPCEDARRQRGALAARLVEVIPSDGLVDGRHIAATLGCTLGTVRQAIAQARQRGAPIVTVGKRYRLGVAS